MSDLICPDLHPDVYVNKRCELDFNHDGMHRAGVLRWARDTPIKPSWAGASLACDHGPRRFFQGQGRGGRWAAWFCPVTYEDAMTLDINPCPPIGAEYQEEDEPHPITFEEHMKEVEEKCDFDVITKPEHYNTHPSGIEPIQITKHMPFCEGNVIKYVMRAPYKGRELEDLRKAYQYLGWAIEMAEARAEAA